MSRYCAINVCDEKQINYCMRFWEITMYRFYAACILAWCLHGGATYANDGLVIDADALEKRETLLQWSTSLTSFSGKYTRTEANLDPDSPNKNIQQVYDIEFRFENDNKYVDYFSPVTEERNLCAYIEKNCTSLQILREAPEATITSKYFVKRTEGRWEPPYPKEMLFPPYTTFLQEMLGIEISISDFLSQGRSMIYERDGQRILIHRNPTLGRAEIQFDAGGRVKKVVLANDWKDEEIAPYYSGGALALYYPFTSYEYQDYQQINGVWFPLESFYTNYSGGQPLKEIMAQRNRGEISGIAAEVMIASTVSFFPNNVAGMKYDPASLRINEKLGDAAFKIKVPGDALELDGENRVILPEEENRFISWIKSHKIIAISIMAVLIGAMGFLIYRIKYELWG